MVMPAETLATSKVKIAEIYALVRRNLMIYTEIPGEWLSFRRFTSKLSCKLSWKIK